ncbi:MAG: hypothetical protein II305_06105 [Clostridia bacterium]|nr:hypothetical protein [Clostridia bacterium]MBQ5716186.1 hypothetical protein [Clostridia bacterium]
MKKTKLDKEYFYEQLKPFSNKYLPIHFDCPISKENLRFRIIFSWHSRKPNGDFNPIMSCQLVDTFKQGIKKYVVPDLIFDCKEEGVTTDFKLYKYLSKWIDNALEGYNTDLTKGEI